MPLIIQFTVHDEMFLELIIAIKSRILKAVDSSQMAELQC